MLSLVVVDGPESRMALNIWMEPNKQANEEKQRKPKDSTYNRHELNIYRQSIHSQLKASYAYLL